MIIKYFSHKKITIRKITKSDLKNAKKFQVFINSLIAEDAKILINKKFSLKDEKKFLEKILAGIKSKTRVSLVAECDDKIIGVTNIELGRGVQNHIGKFGITIMRGYRGVGLGKYLMSEVIRLAKEELNPKPKIIQLEVYVNNIPAINLYKKLGFKIVGKIPKQIQYKGKLIAEFIMMRET
jgi:RimJ/RimL family protein N-acetyltransferase